MRLISIFVVCKKSAMQLLMDAVAEFYLNFLEKIDHSLVIDGTDVIVSYSILCVYRGCFQAVILFFLVIAEKNRRFNHG